MNTLCVVLQGRIRSNLALLLTVGQGIALIGGVLSIGMYTLLLSGFRLTPSVAPLLYIPSVVSATGACIFAFGFLRLARELDSSQ